MIGDERMNTYYVKFKIDAQYIAEVEANSIDEAIRLSKEKFCDADFGMAEDIDGNPIIVEDEDGNFIWEKGNSYAKEN